MKRAPLADLPFWPRFLSRDEAARYVGASPDVFEAEVCAGIWPPALRRGPRGGKATWDRVALDRAADRASGIAESPASPPIADPARDMAKAALMAAVKGFGDHRG